MCGSAICRGNNAGLPLESITFLAVEEGAGGRKHGSSWSSMTGE